MWDGDDDDTDDVPMRPSIAKKPSPWARAAAQHTPFKRNIPASDPFPSAENAFHPPDRRPYGLPTPSSAASSRTAKYGGLEQWNTDGDLGAGGYQRINNGGHQRAIPIPDRSAFEPWKSTAPAIEPAPYSEPMRARQPFSDLPSGFSKAFKKSGIETTPTRGGHSSSTFDWEPELTSRGPPAGSQSTQYQRPSYRHGGLQQQESYAEFQPPRSRPALPTFTSPTIPNYPPLPQAQSRRPPTSPVNAPVNKPLFDTPYVPSFTSNRVANTSNRVANTSNRVANENSRGMGLVQSPLADRSNRIQHTTPRLGPGSVVPNSGAGAKGVGGTKPRGRSGMMASGIQLRSVSDLPDRFRTLFSFPYFNAVQSKCYDVAFGSENNLVVSAPTGSGKTCVMELAILRQLSKPDNENSKVVYMAPTKALCNERTRDWAQKFRTLGLTCNELTGDTDSLKINDVQKSNIIVTTPEKWDSMTRRWRDYKNLMGLVKLILIDECHSLNEAGRGATLEVVVSRMKTVNAELQRIGGGGGNDRFNQVAIPSGQIRFVAVSATVPNIEDLALWLKNGDGSMAEIRVFGEEFRPVQLQREVLGFYSSKAGYFAFENTLDYKLGEVIDKNCKNKPSLVFCATRKSVSKSAKRLVIHCQKTIQNGAEYGSQHPFVKNRQHHEQLRAIKAKLIDKELADLVIHGIAFHHGGLTYSDRNLIESSFLKSIIMVICATSTLAVGVNLPAHLVVIKGTMQYVAGTYKEYSELDVMQMLGRAGRPQFDDSGVAIIMTSMEDRPKFEALVTGQQIIESNLHENLIEHLNSEIVLGAIRSVDLALEWLQSSFLYVRMKKNPGYYKLKNCSTVEGKLSAETRLESICLRDLELLSTHELVHMVDANKSLLATEYGKAMTKYYIKYQTAVSVLQMKPKATMRDALETLCQAEEFGMVRFHADKAHLNALNKNLAMRYPIKGRVSSAAQKVNILIQCALGTIAFTEKTGPTMALETQGIMSQACRIARFMIEICVAKGDYVSLKSCVDLARCLHAKTWENSPLLLKQIEGVGPALASMFSKAGILTFDKLESTEATQIEFRVNRNPPFGSKVLEWVAGLPQFKMEISQFKDLSRPTDVELFVNISVTNSNARLGEKRFASVAFLAGTSDNVFIDFRRFTVKKLKEGESFKIKVQLQSASQKIICSLLNEEVVGRDFHKEIIPDVKPMHFRNLRHAQTGQQKLESRRTASALAANVRQSSVQSVRTDEFDFDDGEVLDDPEIGRLLDAGVGGGDHVYASQNKEDYVPELPPPIDVDEIIPVGSYTSRDKDIYSTAKLSKQVSDYPIISPSSISTPRKGSTLEPGNKPCGHKCKNKQSCTHTCCKMGVPEKRAARRKNPQQLAKIQPQERLSQSPRQQQTQLHQYSFSPRQQQQYSEYNDNHTTHVHGESDSARMNSQQSSHHQTTQYPVDYNACPQTPPASVNRRKPRVVMSLLPSDKNYDDEFPSSDEDDDILLPSIEAVLSSKVSFGLPRGMIYMLQIELFGILAGCHYCKVLSPENPSSEEQVH
ncbi:Sec63 Brl domain-containing protein [Phlyctochytrium arcticum]|nr:Sec63 Brl domain-containing protein [Phlyctochytrium arcticum]